MIANSNTVDAFCGVGGNAIQFAKQGSRVLAIDLDETRLACARHNAIVYGVEELITFVCGDFMTLDFTDYPLFKTPETAVFLSPPWGGPSYLSLPTYNLSYLPIPNLHSKCLQISSNICYFMPRNMNEDDMIELGGGERVELEKMFLENKFKVLQCYYGDLVGRQVDFE